jgi:hypothetical protein
MTVKFTGLLLAFALTTLLAAGANAGGRLELTFSGGKAEIELNDSAAARDLFSMLPLTLTFDDYNNTEKIAYPPRKLATKGAPSSYDPSKGDFALYAPWGNLVIYYMDFTDSPGLVPLGRVTSGLDKLAAMNGKFSAAIKAVK